MRLKQGLVRGVAPVSWSVGWGRVGGAVVAPHTAPGAEGTRIAFPKPG